MELKFMINKIVIKSLLLAALIGSGPSYSDSLIMCPGGRVKTGDTYEVVKSRCPSISGFSSSSKMINGKRVEYKAVKTKFRDGTKAAFIYLDGVLLDVIVFD